MDDHPVMLDGLANLINRQPDLEVSWTATNPEEALTILGSAKPDLFMTDLTMPGRSGGDFVKDIVEIYPDLPILILSMHDESLYAERLIRAGARGYIMKEAGVDNLLAAIRQVLDGTLYLSPKISARLLTSLLSSKSRTSTSPIGELTDREFEVFQLIGKGSTTQQIATQLGISPKTVDVHRTHIREKLNIADSTALMRFAVRWIETEGKSVE